MPFEYAYLRALDEPAIGYAASPKFILANRICPKCKCRVWIRILSRTRTPIGLTCEGCPWVHTYTLPTPLPPAPTQEAFPGVVGHPKRTTHGKACSHD